MAAENQDRRRWWILILLAVSELMGMSLWFTASAVSSQLKLIWGLDTSQVGWLTTIVQVGFVVGTATAAILNFADIFPSRAYFAIAALLGAASNAFLITVTGFEQALVCRFFTGFFLAGVYPPAMKMIATWFKTSRGFAIGTIVGALTIGKAPPYLVRAFNEANWHIIVLTASGGCFLAAIAVGLFYRDGPNPFARRNFSWGLVGAVIRHRETRLATSGYLVICGNSTRCGPGCPPLSVQAPWRGPLTQELKSPPARSVSSPLAPSRRVVSAVSGAVWRQTGWAEASSSICRCGSVVAAASRSASVSANPSGCLSPSPGSGDSSLSQTRRSSVQWSPNSHRITQSVQRSHFRHLSASSSQCSPYNSSLRWYRPGDGRLRSPYSPWGLRAE